MAIIDTRGESERIMRNLALLGAGIRQLTMTPEDQLRAAVRQAVFQNPAILAQAGREFERNIQANPPAGIADANVPTGQVQMPAIPGQDLGFSPAMVASLMQLFPAGFQEQLDVQLREQGAPQAIARAQVAGAQADTAESGVRLETAERTQQYGLPELSAALKQMQLRLGMQDVEVNEEVLNAYKDYFQHATEDEKRLLGVAAQNPTYFQRILQDERMAYEERLRGMLGSNNPVEMAIEMFKLRRDFHSEFDEISDRLKEAEGPEEMEALIARWNTVATDYTRFFPHDPVTILDSVEKLFGKRIKDARMRTLIPDDVRVNIAAARIASGEWDATDLAKASIPEELKNRIMQRVTEMQSRSEAGFIERTMDATWEWVKGQAEGAWNFLLDHPIQPGPMVTPWNPQRVPTPQTGAGRSF